LVVVKISEAPALVPIVKLYPVAVVMAFQDILVSIATLVALFNGSVNAVHTGAVGKVSVVNELSVHESAFPKVLKGTTDT
jgi:hypothetical protein